MPNRFCVVCGKKLPESVSKNASTHPGDCRDENTQSLLKKHNRQVKTDKIRTILTFLEERFHHGVNIDAICDMLSGINMYHTSIDDFVMTAYYLSVSESDESITVRDIQTAADAWDEMNNGKRSNTIKQRIVKILDTIEQYHDASDIHDALKSPDWRNIVTKIVWNQSNVPDNEYSLYINRAFSRIKRLLNQKFGYSKNAYKILKRHIDVDVRDTDEHIEQLIRSTATVLAIDPSHVDEMISLYINNLQIPLRGRDAVVVTGGILYYISQAHSLSLSQETIAIALNISSPSLRKVYYTIFNVMNNVIAPTS
jgi:hypothetical protein